MKKNLFLAFGLIAGIMLSGCEMITSTTESDITATKGSYSFGIKDNYVWNTYTISKYNQYTYAPDSASKGTNEDSGTLSSLNLWSMNALNTLNASDTALVAYLDLTKYYAKDSVAKYDSLIDSFSVTITLHANVDKPLGVVYNSFKGDDGCSFDTMYNGTHTYKFSHYANTSSTYKNKIYFSILSFYDSTVTERTKTYYSIDSIHLIFK